MLTVEKLAQELNETPELKRRVVMNVARVLLDSEAFMEAYPNVYEPEKADTDEEYRAGACWELAKIITRLLRKNRVRVQDAEEIMHQVWLGYCSE